jgi:CitMHS family citrate-Mg2+:H+ or citrate-Ca2+:H+ symporter
MTAPAIIGLVAVASLVVLILTGRTSPIVALIIVPVVAALAGGLGGKTSELMVSGLAAIAPTAAMFVFAVLFFGVMTDAGLLDPVVRWILKAVGMRPSRIAVGGALLALLTHLDGSGAVCFLVTIPAMTPLYDRLGMDRRVLACTASMAAGVNFLPWTGPMVRASAALKIPVLDIFRPMIWVQAAGLAFVFAASWWLGRREERRLGKGFAGAELARITLSAEDAALRRPGRYAFNLVLTLAVMAALISGVAPPAAVFMVGAALALLVNYPNPAAQRERIDAHAKSALLMGAVLLAAGVFTGIMTGSGMLKALAQAAVSAAPPGGGQHIPLGLSLIAMPLSLLFDPDSFYFGVLPVIAQMHAHLGGAPVQVAQAAVVGQMTAGFPVSPLTPATFLVAGLSGIELREHQKFAFPFLYAASLVMALACVLLGLFPI